MRWRTWCRCVRSTRSWRRGSKKTGRSASWLADETAIIADLKIYRNDPADSWRRLGKPRTNNRRTLALVRELAAWREAAAQKRDIPRNRLVRDEALLEIAAHPPKDIEELAGIRALGRSVAEGRIGAGTFWRWWNARTNCPMPIFPSIARATSSARRYRAAG